MDPLQKKTRNIIRDLKKIHPRAGIVLHYGNPWELTVAVILSAQTTDVQVNKVTEKLFQKYRSLDDYAQARVDTFADDIKSIGLYRSKAKNILSTARILRTHHNGHIPRDMTSLIALPGIGRKTANVILGNVYRIVEGIAVDTHVRRFSQLFGLTRHSDPEKIERDLMKLVPRKDWFKLTYLLIDYGRAHCPARCKHQSCPLRKYIKKIPNIGKN